MRHVDAQTFAFPLQILRHSSAYFVAVDIAANAPQWLERFQLFHDLEWSEIARVPDFVAFGEIRKNRWIEESVRVRQQANAHAFMRAKSQWIRNA